MDFLPAIYFAMTPQQKAIMNQIVRDNSAFKSMYDLIYAKGDYTPSIKVDTYERLMLADVYDYTQQYNKSSKRAYRYGTPPKPLPIRIRERIRLEKERLVAETKLYQKGNAGFVAACTDVTYGHRDESGVVDKDYSGQFTIKDLKKYIARHEDISVDEVATAEWKYRYFVEGEVNCADNWNQYINRDKNNDWFEEGWIDAREFWSVDVLRSDVTRKS